MNVTQQHRDAAIALVEPVGPLNSPRDTGLTAPAAAGFLAAIERIEPDDLGGITHWQDAGLDEGSVFLHDAPPGSVRLVLTGEGERVVHDYTPDDVEKRGWDLIVAAYRARQSRASEGGPR